MKRTTPRWSRPELIFLVCAGSAAALAVGWMAIIDMWTRLGS